MLIILEIKNTAATAVQFHIGPNEKRYKKSYIYTFYWNWDIWKVEVKTTFNNISFISWRSVLMVEEAGVPRENHQPIASHWQTSSHNVVSEYTSPDTYVNYIFLPFFLIPGKTEGVYGILEVSGSAIKYVNYIFLPDVQRCKYLLQHLAQWME